MIKDNKLSRLYTKCLNILLTFLNQTIDKPHVIRSPNELEPVLALINHIGELAQSEWYEVVYYYQGWCSYADDIS